MSAPLLEVLTKAAGYLKNKGVQNARLDAELLFAHALKVKRLDLYLQFDRPLSDTELESYRAMIRRRGLREPLQHILGTSEFRELRLKVDRRALIPRPETEILLDVFKKNLPSSPKPRILDVGVGTGAIALSVLKEFPQCETSACDVSADCLALTAENAGLNSLPQPELARGNLFDAFAPERRWDAILSNPPYVAEAEINGLEPEVRDFDPRLALSGGPLGWEIPAALIEGAFPRVEPGGFLLLEIGPPQFELLRAKALSIGWKTVEGHADYEKTNRFFLCYR